MKFNRNLLAAFVLCGLTMNAEAAVSVIATDVYNGSTYQLLSSDTWVNSETFAQSKGAHLLTINDLAENTWLTTQAFSQWGLSHSFWIGYYRNPSNPSQFVWADGSTSGYTNWAPGEPNDSNSYNSDAENYVHTYLNYAGGSRFGKWNDLANVDPFEGPKYGVIQLTSAVPEPTSAGLLALGLGLMGLRRKKQ